MQKPGNGRDASPVEEIIAQISRLVKTIDYSSLTFKEIYCIPEDEYRKNKNFFVELFQVQELMDVQVRTLSLGERMKMELIVALLHNPKILFYGRKLG